MGLKFRPSFKPPTEAQFDLQIKDFCRRIRLLDLFAHQPDDPDFNPRMYVPNESTATKPLTWRETFWITPGTAEKHLRMQAALEGQSYKPRQSRTARP